MYLQILVMVIVRDQVRAIFLKSFSPQISAAISDSSSFDSNDFHAAPSVSMTLTLFMFFWFLDEFLIFFGGGLYHMVRWYINISNLEHSVMM